MFNNSNEPVELVIWALCFTADFQEFKWELVTIDYFNLTLILIMISCLYEKHN